MSQRSSAIDSGVTDQQDVASRTIQNSVQSLHHTRAAIAKALSSRRTPVLHVASACGVLLGESLLNIAKSESFPVTPTLISLKAGMISMDGTRLPATILHVRCARERSLERRERDLPTARDRGYQCRGSWWAVESGQVGRVPGLAPQPPRAPDAGHPPRPSPPAQRRSLPDDKPQAPGLRTRPAQTFYGRCGAESQNQG